MKKSANLVAPFLLAMSSTMSMGQTQPPEFKCISLIFHSIPNDPQSSVSLVVTLLMTSVSVDGNSVGWGIDAAFFARPIENGGWKQWQSGPIEVNDSIDGLWWVTHADISAPAESEFTVLPALAGWGEPEAPGDAELLFVIEASESGVQADPNAPYSLQTAYGRYYFTDGDLEVDGDEDPVEVDEPDHPGVQ